VRQVRIVMGLVILALVALGLCVLASAGAKTSLVVKQSGYFAAAAVVGTVMAAFDYRKWREWKWLPWATMAVTVVLLIVVRFFCEAKKGSHRWIEMGPISLQPGEMAKLMAVFMTAWWIDKVGWRIELFIKGVLPIAGIIGLLGLLTIIEPDFGTTIVIAITAATILFVGGIRWRHMLPVMAAAVIAIGVTLWLNPNRLNRLLAFRDRTAEITGDAKRRSANDQLNNSLVAFGNAVRDPDLKPWWDPVKTHPWWNALTGSGYMQSMQKKAYLPEHHTDFIFAIGAEELGLVFSLGILALYTTLFVCGYIVSRKASDTLGRLLAFGMSFTVFFQVLFNVGVVCGVLPTKGLALPFISYGGTHVITTAIAMGTIFSVAIRNGLQKERIRSKISVVRFS